MISQAAPGRFGLPLNAHGDELAEANQQDVAHGCIGWGVAFSSFSAGIARLRSPLCD